MGAAEGVAMGAAAATAEGAAMGVAAATAGATAEAVAMGVVAATAVAMAAEAEAQTMAPITPVPRVALQTAHTVRKQLPAPTPMVMAWHQMGRFPAHSVH